MPRKIAIVGSGANGTSIGVDVARAGHDVTLIDQWPAHVEAMRKNGATVAMPEETLVQPVNALHLCEVCTLKEPFDVVLVVTKAYDARWSSQLIEPWLKEDGLLVAVQNGMTAGTVAEVVGPGAHPRLCDRDLVRAVHAGDRRTPLAARPVLVRGRQLPPGDEGARGRGGRASRLMPAPARSSTTSSPPSG